MENVDWMHMAQDRVQWCAVVDMVMNFRVLEEERNILAI
jgi:hypothetical protein